MEFGSEAESKYRVVYQYRARREDELSINTGDLILQVEVREGEGGWARGKLNGDYGYFPLNHVTRVSMVDPVVPSYSERHHRVLHPLDLQLGARVEFITESEPGRAVGSTSSAIMTTGAAATMSSARNPAGQIIVRQAGNTGLVQTGTGLLPAGLGRGQVIGQNTVKISDTGLKALLSKQPGGVKVRASPNLT